MCEFCDGKSDYSNTYATMQIANEFNDYVFLKFTFDKCPKYAECSAKDNKIKSIFPIKYCPECGKKLERKMEMSEEIKNCEERINYDCISRSLLVREMLSIDNVEVTPKAFNTIMETIQNMPAYDLEKNI